MPECIECAICKDTVDIPTTGRVDLSCAHTFHMRCIGRWFTSNPQSTCPLCRKPAEPLERLGPDRPIVPPLPPGAFAEAVRARMAERSAEPPPPEEEPPETETRDCDLTDLHSLLVANEGHGLSEESMALLQAPGSKPITFDAIEHIAFGNNASLSRSEWESISRPVAAPPHVFPEFYPVSPAELNRLMLERGGHGLPEYILARPILWLSWSDMWYLFVGNGANPIGISDLTSMA